MQGGERVAGVGSDPAFVSDCAAHVRRHGKTLLRLETDVFPGDAGLRPLCGVLAKACHLRTFYLSNAYPFGEAGIQALPGRWRRARR